MAFRGAVAGSALACGEELAGVLLTCEAIYGVERGARMLSIIERSTGVPCPCKQGKACPLMPSESLELEPLGDALHGLA